MRVFVYPFVRFFSVQAMVVREALHHGGAFVPAAPLQPMFPGKVSVCMCACLRDIHTIHFHELISCFLVLC